MATDDRGTSPAPLFPPFNRLKPCRYGTMLYNIHDRYIGRSLDAYGEFSEGEIDLFRQILKPGQVVLDIGANIGAHTVYFAQAVGPEGRVLAFEPQRIIYQTLCANAAINSLTNVHCWNAAVGDTPGEIVVPYLDYARENNFGGLSLEGHRDGERVPLLTIDGLNLAHCALIKIDVEGMEQSVLQGAVATIARCKPVLYVENDREKKSEALIRTIDSLGFDIYWHRPPYFNPRNFAGNSNNIFGKIISLNMLCCPREMSHQIKGFERVDLR